MNDDKIVLLSANFTIMSPLLLADWSCYDPVIHSQALEEHDTR